MRRPLAAAAAVLSASILVVAGCSSDSDDDSSGGDLLGSVDTMFGTIDVPQPEDGELTVVALGWSDAEMALALGVKPVAVFDWQAFGEENKGVGPWATDDFGDATPTVIPAGQELNYEQIAGFNPDLILNVRSDNDQATYERLSGINGSTPTIYAPEGTDAFATAWDVQLKSIAAAVGQTEKADEVIADITGQIETASADNPEFRSKTVASGTKFGDAYGAYLAGDLRFDLLAALGFVQNPPILELPASGFFANVSAENIGALDADVATFLPIGFTLEQTQTDPLIQSLNVVKEDRAVFIDPLSELSGAWSAGSALSIPIVIEQLVPQLKEAAGKLPTAS